MKTTILRILMPVLILLIAAGCAQEQRYDQSAYGTEPSMRERTKGEAVVQAAEASGEYMEDLDYAFDEMPTSENEAFYRDDGKGAQNTAVNQKQDQQDQKRKRIYSGFLQLIVDSIIDTKTAISEEVDRIKGYAESSYSNTMIIRVPAETFDSTMAFLQGLGVVKFKSVETADVTEFYSDLQTRLRIAETTRERYYTLLENTQDVEERLKILREIRRLTENIEWMNLIMQGLEQQIAFSRITIELEARLDNAQKQQADIPFTWIARLNPLKITIMELHQNITLNPGENFAVFDREGETYYYAESADGVRIKIGDVPNEPKGDAAFWQQALQYNLDPIYAESALVEFGDLKGVLFTSRDTEAFYYLIGVQVVDKNILVTEVFFPNGTAKADNYPVIEKALQEMEAGK